ncbi:MAG: hypothetical protein K2X43_17740 [Hyphomonadaceae bacterium]|jgi:hypothetical protein|nr:hypothetical protein [Hyphomonadaceae bacterium]
MRTRPAFPGALAALLVATVPASLPAGAATCADRIVQARGEPSRFEVLAKAKARGNWRAQVRTMPTLGPLYANWNQALSADYRCAHGKAGHRCTAVARPCRE